jgi:hypothetical protein
MADQRVDVPRVDCSTECSECIRTGTFEYIFACLLEVNTSDRVIILYSVFVVKHLILISDSLITLKS